MKEWEKWTRNCLFLLSSFEILEGKRLFKRLFFLFLLPYLLLSSEIGRAFKEGKLKGHVGTLINADFVGDSTYLDLSTSLAYETANFYGYKFFASMWFNPKLYEVNRGFRDNKTWLEFPELGVNFYNTRLNFGFDAGRFAYQRDWINNYVQGLSFFHSPTSWVDYEITWINRSAWIDYYRVRNYEGAGNWIGGLWASANFKIPNTTLVLTPYAYSVANHFWSPAIKARMDFFFPNISGKLEAMATLLFYTAYHDKKHQGDSLMYWSDLTWKDTRGRYEAGGGIMVSAIDGVRDIDIFGQNTGFEDTTGLFDSNMTTLYAFGKFNFKYDISLKTSMRTSISPSTDVIFGWETRANYFPIKDLEVGLDLILIMGAQKLGLGSDQGKMRAYLQYHF